METDEIAAPSRKERMRDAARSGESWAGYAWFMTLGTLLPLLVFFGGYLVNVTLVGAPLARRIYRFGIWLATVGQKPPGQDKVDARMEARRAKASGKESRTERIRRYTPPEMIKRRGRPVAMPMRVGWFVLVGWWLGAFWVVVCWSPFLLAVPGPWRGHRALQRAAERDDPGLAEHDAAGYCGELSAVTKGSVTSDRKDRS